MKRKLFLLLAAMLVIAACSPAAATLVRAPDELRLIILVVATAVVARVLEVLAIKIPQLDFRQYTTQVAAAIAGAIIVVTEQLLGLIPPAHEAIAETLLHLLVLILGGVGTLFVLKQYRTPGFRGSGARDHTA